MAGRLTVFLVPVGRDRFELYSEVPDQPPEAPGAGEGLGGVARRSMHAIHTKWHALAEAARRGGRGRSRFVRWRDGAVRRLAETIAEQRTLWALRDERAAELRLPSTLDAAQARQTLDRLLADARRHHLRWLIGDAVLCAITGPLFFFVPGPNLIGIYFLFRVIGHLQSWRGARNAMDSIAWTIRPDDRLAELATLLDLPRPARAARVAAIAAELNLPHLAAYFDRVAARVS
jgi:hypothetical protein